MKKACILSMIYILFSIYKNINSFTVFERINSFIILFIFLVFCKNKKIVLVAHLMYFLTTISIASIGNSRPLLMICFLSCVLYLYSNHIYGQCYINELQYKDHEKYENDVKYLTFKPAKMNMVKVMYCIIGARMLFKLFKFKVPYILEVLSKSSGIVCIVVVLHDILTVLGINKMDSILLRDHVKNLYKK